MSAAEDHDTEHDDLVDDDEAAFAPTRLGRYRVCDRIARGGMASVYLAETDAAQGFRKTVALKVVHPHLADDPTFEQMFFDEARLAARIDHPNVCAVFDAGHQGAAYYLAMEYLHGRALREIAQHPAASDGLPCAIAARVVADAAAGLHAAHELRAPDGSPAQVVHRDVTPHNLVVLFDGVTKVVDFGIARSTLQRREATDAGLLRGKLAYMAPEQVRRQPVDRRADIFALGIVLWEALTGERLFQRDDDVETMLALVDAPVRAPSRLRAEVPPALDRIALRALEREPSQRYATAAEMARALEGFLAESGQQAGPGPVAAWMRALFPDAASEQARIEPRPSGSSTHPARRDATRVAAAPRQAATTETGASTSRRSTLRRAWVAGPGAALALSIAAGLLASRARARHAESARPQRGAAALGPTTAAPAAPRAPAAGLPAPTPAGHLAPAPAGDFAPASIGTLPASGAAMRPHASHPRHARSAVETRGAPGYLDLVAVPSASVFEAGRGLGATPWVRRAMTPGRHVLRLVPSDARPARTVTVQITAGASTRASVRW